MRVSFIIQDLFSLGAQYVTALLVRGFVKRGYDVDVVVSRIHDDLMAQGGSPFPVPKATNWIHLPYRKARQNIFALRQYLRQTDAFAVIAMSSNYSECLAIASIGLINHPYIYHVEHSGGVGVGFGRKGSTRRPSIFSWRYVRNRIIFDRFHKLLAVSEGTADALSIVLPYPREKIGVVYNPVIDDLFYEKVSKRPSHPWLMNKSIPTFIAAGAHTGFKNHKLAIKAIAEASKITPCRLIIFGDGPLTEDYKSYIRDNNLESIVSLPGFTNNLPSEIKASNGFICTSLVESFSVVIVEALACGVPVISTDCPYGPREILLGGKYGTLVAPDDVKKLADAIVGSLKSPKTADPKSWERFSLEKIISIYERELGLVDYVYPVSKGSWNSYTRNANAFQKIKLVTANLDGRILIDRSVLNDLPSEFNGRWIDKYSVRRKTIVCQAPSNEKMLFCTLIRALLGEKQVLFCWDPPGVSRRNSKHIVARIRCLLMDVLLKLCIKRAYCLVLNLHIGFLENRNIICNGGKIRSFPNGTCVEYNRLVSSGVNRVTNRLIVNNAFTENKDCYGVASIIIGIKKQVPKMSIVWVGEGDRLEKVRRMLLDGGFNSADIIAMGKMPHDMVLKYIASSAVALNAYPDAPSLRWNFLLKLPEFLSLGVPVVSVALPGSMEYIKNGHNGYLFEPADEKSAINLVSRLFLDSNIREKLSVNAAHSAEKYDWNRINKEIAAYIREVVKIYE